MKSKTPKGEGNCYDANGREFLDLCQKNKNADVEYVMVHGVVKNSVDNKPMGHAWIEAIHELGTIKHVICLDFANNHAHSLSQETYYFIGAIDPEKTVKYSCAEFKEKILESGHWGHWELTVDR